MARTPFLLPLVLLSALAALATWGGLYACDVPFTWQFVLLLVYYPAITTALLTWQERAAGQTNVFIRRFMGGLVMKLLASIVLGAILLKATPASADKPLLLAFAALYVTFLAFSTMRLSRVMRSTVR